MAIVIEIDISTQTRVIICNEIIAGPNHSGITEVKFLHINEPTTGMVDALNTTHALNAMLGFSRPVL